MDEIDELLTPRETAGPPGRQDELWQQTGRVLRRRRWVRVARRGAAWAACFAAGAASAWLVASHPHEQQVRLVVNVAPPTPTPASPPAPPGDRYANDPPDRLERWAAMKDGDERAGLYRRAGDGFLARGDDLAALRCYRKALRDSTPAQLAIEPDRDTWLMMSLKIARQKEVRDARN
jgi:hypothetical protein